MLYNQYYLTAIPNKMYPKELNANGLKRGGGVKMTIINFILSLIRNNRPEAQF
jgi:hypothetical protein